MVTNSGERNNERHFLEPWAETVNILRNRYRKTWTQYLLAYCFQSDANVPAARITVRSRNSIQVYQAVFHRAM